MMQSAPYYWVTCDEPGCDARCPDHEVTAWSDSDTAIDSAEESDWSCERGPLTWVTFCPAHRPDSD